MLPRDLTKKEALPRFDTLAVIVILSGPLLQLLGPFWLLPLGQVGSSVNSLHISPFPR